MTTFRLKFALPLHDLTESHGATFHRWVPDGEKDALTCPTGTRNARMKVWFERRGFPEFGPDSHITYAYNRHEFDPATMERQGSLEGGYLFGLLEIDNLTPGELKAVRSGIADDPDYEALAERLVDLWLYPQLSRLIHILRANFGQYWLRQLEPFDSRRGSIGAYWGIWHVSWAIDDDQTWTPFRPNLVFNVGSLGGRGREYLEYLTREDWRNLQAAMTDNYEPSLAAQLLGNAHGHLDKGDVALSLVEGVAALETALQEFVGQWGGSADTPDMSDVLRKLRLPKGLEIVAAASRKLSPAQVETVAQAIKLRNDVVHHRAKLPSKDQMIPKARALLRAVAVFVEGPEFKFPSAFFGHLLMSPSSWENLK